MPKVGKQLFTYDEAGRKAAEIESELTGEPVIDTEGAHEEEAPVLPAPGPEPVPGIEEPIIPTYDAGGRVERIMGYGDGGKVKKIPKTLESLTPEVNKSTSDKKSDKKKKTIDSELFKQIKESLLDPRKAKTIPLPEFPPLEPTKKKTKRQKILDAAKRILKGKKPKKELEDKDKPKKKSK